MMEGENVKAFAHPINIAQPKAGSSGCDGIKRRQEPRYCRHQSFDEFIQHQIQALIFCHFWIKPTCEASLKTDKNINTAEKSESLSAAVSRGKTERREKMMR
ncbi:hypothetical protein [Pedobacter sp. UBA5917]|jgi:hypothetical protein|uniref:hypothetical protein n=1 Tax=Pedobacter sp. UBA5917 TaxID=1947061 RepID=UPI0025E7A5B7|nr:hypothetical protein [Pedobacter sp. UBA5917]